MIPKDENNLTTLSNWRPITLLNVDYKILAKVIAKRIESVLPKLIHSDQTGFIKGRFIGQNVRLLNDLLEYTDVKKIPGILLFIDFEKAFDTIEWPFIQNVLRHFNFGQVIRKWVSILYSDVENAVINGGYMTNYFKVSRGVRQGCPLSPLLFVLGVEILAQKIRQSTGCQGIKLPQSVEAKISQFADDTTLICRDVDALKVAEHSFLLPMRYSSLFSNHWHLSSQNWQGASSTKKDYILICFIVLGTVTTATQLVVNQH